MRARPWLVALLVAAVFALWMVARADLEPRAGVTRVDRVWLAPAESETPPLAGSPEWRETRLPWGWRPHGDGRDVWCRAEFQLDGAPHAPLQLLIAQVAFGADVRVNGRALGSVGRGPNAHWGRREVVWLSIPAAQLNPGMNEIVLRLRVRESFAAYLTPLFVGPAPSLQGAQRARAALSGGIADVLVVVSATLALVHLGVFRRMRGGEWAWLAAACAVLALGGLPLRTADFLAWPLALSAGAICAIVAVHRGAQLGRPRLGRAALAVLAALVLASLMAPARWLFPLALCASALALGGGLYLFHILRVPPAMRWLDGSQSLQVGLTVSLIWGLNDVPLAWGSTPVVGLPLLPIAHLPLLVASFVQIVDFFGGALGRTNELNRSRAESQARLVALEGERAARAERERMQRDLHDGLGAQLVATLALAERTPHDHVALAHSVRLAMAELRAAVDSLGSSDRSIDEALGELRSRLDLLARGAGFALTWRVGDVDGAPRLSPEQVVHLQRVLQEAVANVVKHASARELTLSAGVAERDGRNAAFVELRDDGRGIGSSPPGRGLGNMRTRAAQLGAELAIESSAAGTRGQLWFTPRA